MGGTVPGEVGVQDRDWQTATRGTVVDGLDESLSTPRAESASFSYLQAHNQIISPFHDVGDDQTGWQVKPGVWTPRARRQPAAVDVAPGTNALTRLTSFEERNLGYEEKYSPQRDRSCSDAAAARMHEAAGRSEQQTTTVMDSIPSGGTIGWELDTTASSATSKPISSAVGVEAQRQRSSTMPESGQHDHTMLKQSLQKSASLQRQIDEMQARLSQVSCYVVSELDTLTGIGLALGVSESQLRRHNKLSPSEEVYVGQRLMVPMEGAVQREAAVRRFLSHPDTVGTLAV